MNRYLRSILLGLVAGLLASVVVALTGKSPAAAVPLGGLIGVAYTLTYQSVQGAAVVNLMSAAAPPQESQE